MHTQNKMANVARNVSQEKVVRVKDAARYLGISKATYWRWVKEGKLPKGTKFSQRCTVWKVEDLDNFISNASSQ